MLTDELMRQWPALGTIATFGWLSLAAVVLVIFFRR